MKIEYPVLNQSLEIAKQQIKSELAPVTTKEEGVYNLRIDPFIPVSVAESLILQNNKLDKSIRILAQDVILNDFSFLNEVEDDMEEEVKEFWKNNLNELYKQIQEFLISACDRRQFSNAYLDTRYQIKLPAHCDDITKVLYSHCIHEVEL